VPCLSEFAAPLEPARCIEVLAWPLLLLAVGTYRDVCRPWPELALASCFTADFAPLPDAELHLPSSSFDLAPVEALLGLVSSSLDLIPDEALAGMMALPLPMLSVEPLLGLTATIGGRPESRGSGRGKKNAWAGLEPAARATAAKTRAVVRVGRIGTSIGHGRIHIPGD
jgi:hypothetical protein